MCANIMVSGVFVYTLAVSILFAVTSAPLLRTADVTREPSGQRPTDLNHRVRGELQHSSVRSQPRPPRWKCAGDCCGLSRRKRTCVFRDVLYIDGEYYVPVRDEEECRHVPPVHLKGRVPATADAYFWKNSEPYVMRCLIGSNITRDPDMTVDIGLLMGRGTPFNMAHALLDEFFSIWDGFFELSDDPPTADFTIIAHRKVAREFRRRGGFKSEAALEMYSGQRMQFDDEWMALSKTVRIRKFYFGAANRASKTVTPDYEMPGRKGSLRAFRDRFVSRAKLAQAQQQPLSASRNRVMIIKNKRNLGPLNEHVSAIATHTGAHAYVADLAPLSGAQQILAINSASVLVSGVGTALTSCVFMRDGAVLVNVGEVDANGVVRYWEENIAAGMDWIRVLFYDPHQRRRGVAAADVAGIVRQALGFVDNFSIPVPVRGNLSPLGQVAACLFSNDSVLYNNYMADPHVPPLDGRCIFSQWAEMVVCRYAGWAASAPLPCGHINATLLSLCSQGHNLSAYCR